MKKTLVMAAVSSALLATTAFAGGPSQDQQANNSILSNVYLGVDAGVAIPASNDFGDGLNTGWNLNGHVGYRINKNFRAEGALTFLRNPIKSSLLASGVNAHNNQNFLMANGYYDFTTSMPVVPFIGAGIGWLHNWDSAAANGFTVTGETRNEFAYQGIAGMSYMINDNIGVNVSYHLMSWTSFDGIQNVVDGGVNYYF